MAITLRAVPIPVRFEMSDQDENDIQPSAGYDRAVLEAREKRKLTFGKNSKKVAKPSTILLDIFGVICPWQFVNTLNVFVTDNMAIYLKENWKDTTLQAMIARLRDQASIDMIVDKDVPQIAEPNADQSEQIETATTSILWQIRNNYCTTRVSS